MTMIDLTTARLRAQLRRQHRLAWAINLGYLALTFVLAMGAAYWWAL